jgi:hypothetical protein
MKTNENLNDIQHEEKIKVEYKNDFYDITEFFHKHPGWCFKKILTYFVYNISE